MGVADAGQIVVTASVVAAVTGQTATFDSLGPQQLKGLPGTWELYRLVDTAPDPT
jgi:class 3 adenylate cyclase